ncbi:MAG: hypothetical protein LBH82_05910 [Bacteroidales bacterium]|nr:hypothetical protein [Bacteroidales bacterium]
MDTQQYKSLLNNITDVSDKVNINLAVKKYPYCMLFRLCKALQTKSDEDKSMVSILHPNRKYLSSLFSEEKKSEKPPLPPKEEQPAVSEVVTENKEENPTKQTEDPMSILQQRLSELKQETAKNEEPADMETEDTLYEPQPSVSLDELVEKFNKFPPVVSYNPADFDDEKNRKDMGKSSLQEKTNIVSETLAELYVSQEAYDKAIKIYEALAGKHPEKNAIFAKLIESLKEKKKS